MHSFKDISTCFLFKFIVWYQNLKGMDPNAVWILESRVSIYVSSSYISKYKFYYYHYSIIWRKNSDNLHRNSSLLRSAEEKNMLYFTSFLKKMDLKKQKQEKQTKNKKTYQLIHYKFVVKSWDEISAQLNEFTKLLLWNMWY